MKNTLPVVSALRQPRGLLKVDGVAVSGWMAFDIDENEFAQPDTFNTTLAISGLPESRDAAWWAKADKAEVEVFAGFPADPDSFTDADLDSVFLGTVDNARFDWAELVLTIDGRDHTAKLMDAKGSEKFPNLTASAVAEKIAGKHGLTPKVTATTGKVGRFYQIDHVEQQDARTDWDLLTWLARQEGFMCFVRGKELHFRPKPDESQDPYVVRIEASEDGRPRRHSQVISTSRTLTVAKGIKVIVRSWNSKQKKAFERAAGGGKDPLIYQYSIPGLTPDEAKARAETLQKEISRHAMTLDFSGPADNLLRIDDVIRLEGTGTAFDQVYYPQSIARTITPSDGYDWRVSAKNKAEEAEAG